MYDNPPRPGSADARTGPAQPTDEPLGIASLRRAFEASCLVRCTDVGRLASRAPRGRQARPERAVSPVLAEFNHEQAALRLVELLALTGHRSSHRARSDAWCSASPPSADPSMISQPACPRGFSIAKRQISPFPSCRNALMPKPASERSCPRRPQ